MRRGGNEVARSPCCCFWPEQGARGHHTWPPGFSAHWFFEVCPQPPSAWTVVDPRLGNQGLGRTCGGCCRMQVPHTGHSLATPPRDWVETEGPPGSSQQGPVVQRVGNPLSLCSCSWWDFKAFTRPDSDRGLRSSRMSHSFLPIF